MTVKKITYQQYLSLVGLKQLATEHDKQLKFINLAMLDILQETEEDGSKTKWAEGWCGELTYTERELDEILKIMKIKIEKPNDGN